MKEYYITELELPVKGLIYSGTKELFPVNLTMVNLFLGDSRPNKNFSFFRFFSFKKGTITEILKSIQGMLNTRSKNVDCYFSECEMTTRFNLNSTYEYAGN